MLHATFLGLQYKQPMQLHLIQFSTSLQYNSEQMQQMFLSLNSERSELSSSVIVTDSFDELEKTIDFFDFFMCLNFLLFFWSCLVLGFLSLFPICPHLLNGFLPKRTKFTARRSFPGVKVITTDFFCLFVEQNVFEIKFLVLARNQMKKHN